MTNRTARRRTTPQIFAGLALVASLLLLAAVALVHPTPALAGGVSTGLVDFRLFGVAGAPAVLSATHEDSGQLHAGWMRLNVPWSSFEPAQGTYDEALMTALDAQVNGVRAQGAKVMLTVYSMPQWASDRSYWSHPIPGTSAGYQSYFPMRSAALPEFRAFAHMLASRYAGHVAAIECWNEPNFWNYLYPQRTASDPHFGARTYLRMLKVFSAGVRSAGGRMQVVAGTTMSIGLNDVYRTSPQSFASFLAQHGAARYFDAYSHHPYIPGGSRHVAPGLAPDNPSTTVTLGNIGKLLRVFPRKPFYLSEFAYSTRPNVDFGGLYVSEQAQASYLTQAYAVAGRHPQIKALFWFLAQDQHSSGTAADSGCYTGLRRVDGTKKPSWFAFAQVK